MKAVTNKINICSIKNPKVLSTWSGTPLNIINILSKRNRLGEIIYSDDINKFLLTSINAISIIHYKSSGLN